MTRVAATICGRGLPTGIGRSGTAPKAGGSLEIAPNVAAGLGQADFGEHGAVTIADLGFVGLGKIVVRFFGIGRL